MSTGLRSMAFAGLSVLWCSVSAPAETLRCQSVNGNLNCAGSSGVSCQTINGRTVCVSGHGDVVQSFGNGRSSGIFGEATEGAGHQGRGNVPPGPVTRERLQRHYPSEPERLERDATEIQLGTDWLLLDHD
jgi:hypothetical protein